MAEASDQTSLPMEDKEQDFLSWSDIFHHAWKKIDPTLAFAKALKVMKEKTKTKEKTNNKKEKRQWQVTFVGLMSAIQLFIGSYFIVIALLGAVGALDAKDQIASGAIISLSYELIQYRKELIRNLTDIAEKEKKDMAKFYKELVKNTTNIAEKDRQDMWEFNQRLLKNMTIIAKNEKKALIEQCQNQTKNRVLDNRNEKQSNTETHLRVGRSEPKVTRSRADGNAEPGYTTSTSPFDLYKYNNDPPASHLKHYHDLDFPDFRSRQDWDLPEICEGQSLCHVFDIDKEVKKSHLFLEYLCLPAFWIGIMYIITGLIGRSMLSKKPMEYSRVSQIYAVLNFLGAALFAPGILTVVILQWYQSYYLDYENRLHVGHISGITIVFASVCLVVSLLLCVIGCCCPVSSLSKTTTKRDSQNQQRHLQKKNRMMRESQNLRTYLLKKNWETSV